MTGLSEETATALISQLGELTGSVKAHIENQKVINGNVAAVLEKQDEKVDDVANEVSGFKKTVRGIVIGVGLGGTSLGAAVMKLTGVVGGGHLP